MPAIDEQQCHLSLRHLSNHDAEKILAELTHCTFFPELGLTSLTYFSISWLRKYL